MSGTVALEDYFRRIGFDAEPRPDLETLTQLHRLHPAAIAFENLSTFLGKPVSLDLHDIEAKLVAARRGGYCFEQNRLFAGVLETCGFEVKCLAARVLWNREHEPALPRTHMLLSVTARDGERLCDVGFGGLTMTAPLRLEPGAEQRAGDVVLRVVRSGDDYELAAMIEDRWKPLYRFELRPQLPVDFEMMNHFVCTHPSSHFRTRLMAGRVDDRGRFGLANNRLTHYRPDGSREQRTAASAEELHGMLERELRIAVDLDAELEAALRRCLA